LHEFAQQADVPDAGRGSEPYAGYRVAAGQVHADFGAANSTDGLCHQFRLVGKRGDAQKRSVVMDAGQLIWRGQ
jgi:hypothetical protein